MVREQVTAEPIALTESELDAVAGGWSLDVNIGNFVYQLNASLNQTSTGNNNNGISGNQLVV